MWELWLFWSLLNSCYWLTEYCAVCAKKWGKWGKKRSLKYNKFVNIILKSCLQKYKTNSATWQDLREKRYQPKKSFSIQRNKIYPRPFFALIIFFKIGNCAGFAWALICFAFPCLCMLLTIVAFKGCNATQFQYMWSNSASQQTHLVYLKLWRSKLVKGLWCMDIIHTNSYRA